MNVLIVKLSAIGDVIHALPVAHAIKETWPHSRVDWVVEPAAKPLVDMNRYVDDVIVFDKKKFKTLGGIANHFGPMRKEIQRRRYDAVLDLQGLFKSAAIAFLAKAPVKLGPEWMREGSSLVSKPVKGEHADGHIAERYLDVARALGAKVEKVDFGIHPTSELRHTVKKSLHAQGLPKDARFAALVVGASWETKRWSTENFARLCDLLYKNEIVPVLVGGGPTEERMALEICARAEKEPVNMVSATTLPELAALFEEASVAYGSDTGPSHLAVAVGTPLLMFFGPTLKERNYPYGHPDHVIDAGRECRGCRRPKCPKGLVCLDTITPEAALDGLMNLLKETETHEEEL